MAALRSLSSASRVGALAYRAPLVGSSSSSSVARTFATTARRADDKDTSPVPATPSSPQTPANHSSYGDLAKGRDLALEQHERQNIPVRADLVSDAAPDLKQRSVMIGLKTICDSSGKSGQNTWVLDFDILQGSGRWTNPLMGWASSGDYVQGTSLKFKTCDDAVRFCEKQGWDYHIRTPHKPRIPPKSYSANYSYSPGKLRIHHTK